MAIFPIRNQPIVLCHDAVRAWHHSGPTGLEALRPSHGKLPPTESSSSIDIGVDTNAFRPILI